MRVAVIGQGSAGRRHAQILLDLGHEVVAHDPSAPILPGTKLALSFEAALMDVDAAIIASPSSEHFPQALRALERGIPTLTEKPLATNAEQARALVYKAMLCHAPLAVAMNLRHHPSILRLRAELPSVGRVLRASAWGGSYLPDWHPDEDYSEGYSAQQAQGGGVLLDCAVHEIDYLTWILGPVAAITATVRKLSDLNVDVEDAAVLVLEMASGALVDVSVDYLDRSHARGCRIVGDAGTISEGVPPCPDAYTAQMEQFVAAVDSDLTASLGTSDPATGIRHPDLPSPQVATGADAYRVLRVIDAARLSSEQGRRIEVAS